MIKRFSSSVFQFLRNSSKNSSSFAKFQPYWNFSTQNSPYVSKLNESSFQQIASNLEKVPEEKLRLLENIFKQYITNRDSTALAEVDARNLAIAIWRMGSLAQKEQKYSEAEPYYLEALDILKKNKGQSPEVIIRIQNNLGGLYYEMNQYEKALICLTLIGLKNVANLLEAVQGIHGGDGIQVQNLQLTSQALIGQGKEDEAIEPLNKIISIVKENHHAVPHSHAMASCLDSLGLIYRRKDDLAKAAEAWEQGIQLMKELYSEDVDGLQDLYRSVAEVYMQQENDLQEAESLKKCIEISEKHNKIDVNDYCMLSLAQFHLGEHKEFFENARKYLENTESNFDLEKKGFVLKKMFIVHCMQGEIHLAEKCFESLLVILNDLYGENSAEVAEAYLERVDGFAEQEELKKALDDAMTIFNKNKKLDPSRRLILLMKMGEYYGNEGNWNEALKYFEEAQKLSPEECLGQEGDNLEYFYLLVSKAYCAVGRFEEGLRETEKIKALYGDDSSDKMTQLNEYINDVHEEMKYRNGKGN